MGCGPIPDSHYAEVTEPFVIAYDVDGRSTIGLCYGAHEDYVPTLLSEGPTCIVYDVGALTAGTRPGY